MKVSIPVTISNRHIHMSEEVEKILFGGKKLTMEKYLAHEGGPFSAKEKITIAGPKGKIEGVRVIGPARKSTQVELLRADCFKLGVKAPVRDSGKLDGAATLKLIGPCGEVEQENCGIIALRHVHMNADMVKETGLSDNQMIEVRTKGERAIVFKNVLLKTDPYGNTMMHIDLEEGNAAGLSNNDEVEIIGRCEEFSE